MDDHVRHRRRPRRWRHRPESAGLDAEYGLVDTLNFGGGIDLISAGWSGHGTGTFALPTTTATLAAPGTPIDAGQTFTYTVTVVSKVTAAAVTGNTTACNPQPGVAGGFLNIAVLSAIGQDVPVQACAEPIFPTIVKSPGSAPTQDSAGNWTVSYSITVTYPTGVPDPQPTLGYVLTDAPTLPGGVSLVGDWTAAAANADTPTPDTPTFDGTGTWTITTAGFNPADDGVTQHVYTVTGIVKVTTPPTGTPATCSDTEDSGIVLLNTGTITSGGYTASDDACQVVHYDDVGLVKSASSLPPQGSVEAGDTFTYVLTVTNHGDRPATSVHVTDTDLNNRLDISNLTVSGGVTWSPAPGWTENSGSQPNDVVDLTIDSLALNQSVDITITVTLLPSGVGVGTAIHDPHETPAPPPAPLEALDNEACVQMAGDSVAGNNCDTAHVPVREITGLIYTSCQSDAPLLGWIIRKSSALASSQGSAAWIPLYGGPTTDPSVVNYSEAAGDTNPDPLIWSNLVQWPGTAFTPEGVAIDYPGWRPIEASDIAGPNQYFLPGTTTVMTPAQQALLVFNGLIVDPTELDFAWRQTPIPPRRPRTRARSPSR